MRSTFHSSLLTALAILAITASASAQFTLDGTQARVGQTFDMTVTGGFPNSEYVILVDTDPGPVFFPNAGNLRVDLGFSSDFFAFPSQFIDPNGDGGFSLSIADNAQVARTFYLQALNVDPTDPLVIVPSNARKGTILPDDPTSGSVTTLTMGDDTSTLVPLGMSFPFYGGTYTEVYVNSNGTLSFGAASTGFFVSDSFFLGGSPTIAGLWQDLNPTFGGTVEWDTTSTPGSTWSVRFTNIDDNSFNGPNSFEISLDLNGHILISYGTVNTVDAIVGITPGGAASGAFVDLSALGWEGHNAPLSVYENFAQTTSFDLSDTAILFGRVGTAGYMLFH